MTTLFCFGGLGLAVPAIASERCLDVVSSDDRLIDPMVLETVDLIIGGNFTPDAIGPDMYSAVAARVAAAPSQHLLALKRKFAVDDATATAGSQLHPAVLLDMTYRDEPTCTEFVAQGILMRIKDAIDASQKERVELTRQITRLTRQRNALDAYAKP